MQETSVGLVETSKVDNKSKKNARHRKKNYYNAIRKQMEFYFSDANLSKDRFLRQLIEKDPYVPLETFMTFNKIKKLANSVKDIGRALDKSSILELNKESGTVRRCTEINEIHDADAKTIYVESLPQDADHDWVIRVFSQFGKVAYVSLPKYKISQKLKEFGFVEFENESAVEKALKAFRVFDGVLCVETALPDKLTSVKSYIKEQKKLTKEIIDETTQKLDNAIRGETVEQQTGTESDTSTDSSQPPAKRIKLISDTETPTSEMEPEINPKKKRRKHKKKPKLAADMDRDGVPDISQMKITSKKEWKRLRNKYLNLQRENAAELKRAMMYNNRDSKQSQSTVPRLPVHRSPHNMNFYQDRNKGAVDTKVPVQATDEIPLEVTTDKQKHPPDGESLSKSQLHYESGLIIRIQLAEPCIDVKGFKAEMRQYCQVKYVDVKEGSMEAYLRCESQDSALELTKQIACAEYACEIVTGNREESYWNKIMEDRADKLNKKVKIPSKRGRDKVREKVSNHIRFDDDE